MGLGAYVRHTVKKATSSFDGLCVGKMAFEGCGGFCLSLVVHRT